MLEAIDVHADGLKRAALAAGPAAPVPNCPKWTVHDLVTHIALVHDTITSLAMGREPRPEPPPDWEDVLGWWDGRRLGLREALARNPDTPWTRRMAHETAIHRLDAESALPDPVETRFSPEFANDGIDEFLTFVVPRRGFAVNVRITTPERTWTVGTPGTEVTGDADDVYRAVWGRPHRAAISGDRLPAV
ncbi:maleylpyruvate isomerase family mycothiol-dependent enzyme [Amycolatopsis sp. NPDC049688]|uniref:maleylpyruvate isomerase family mycothiol-dependent enzyme n=1 Tax=Amycolatopsis sp. NPDC049688 TaxID=3154733 RepID=UPI00343EFBA7